MKTFIIILSIIILAFFISSVIFSILSNHIYNKIAIVFNDKFFGIDTSHKLYGKYIKYHKLSDFLGMLCAISIVISAIIIIILFQIGCI